MRRTSLLLVALASTGVLIAPWRAPAQEPASRASQPPSSAGPPALGAQVPAGESWMGRTVGLVTVPSQAPGGVGSVPQRVAVPAGEFWMGRTRLYLMDEIGWQLRERMDDRPVHRVRLGAFAIDPYEVTNAEYARFVAAMSPKSTAPFHWGGSQPPTGKQRHPVYNVTWHDAVAYCTWAGGRLPTEAEWEYAARAGIPDLDYPWGNEYLGAPVDPGQKPVRQAHSGSSTGPIAVASFAPNALGLHDVSGNVWEWTADWYDLHYYAESPVEGPTGPPTGRYKVIRGGSWADTETRLLTLYYRNFAAPDTAQPTIGFRCAGPAVAR